MAFTGPQQSALYRARKRRRERFRRAGAGFPLPNEGIVVERGVGIASPVTNAQGQAPVTLVWEIESFGGFPNAPHLDTGELFVATDAVGVLIATVPSPTVIALLLLDMADVTNPGGGVPPHGLHTYVLAIDPPNNRMAVYIDGKIVEQGTGAFSLWADDTQTWLYADPADAGNFGQVSPLQVFPGYLPPSFE